MFVEIRRPNLRKSLANLILPAWHLLGLVMLFVYGIWTRDLVGEGLVALLSHPKTVNIYLLLLAYVVIAWVNRRLHAYIGTSALGLILGNAVIVYLVVFTIIAITRIPYERSYVIEGLVFSVIWIWLAYRGLAQIKPRMGIISGGFASEVQKQREVDWVLVNTVDGQPLEGLVVDFREVQSPEAAQLVSDMCLRGIPIHHAATAYEQITGRVSVQHLSEQIWTTIQPSRTYLALKRLADTILILLSLPLTLPLMLVVALLIRLDSPGPALFWQPRTGLQGRTFRMLKFRSMYHDVGDSGSPFVIPGDQRVTHMGRILRLLRLNELPQLWNVLIGEMSLIGPRPEQLVLTGRYQDSLPLYMHRYRVRPGITGWAQTMQGYAASDKEIEIKLTFDLYYVKHISMWLDLLIFWRTLASLVSGFGGR